MARNIICATIMVLSLTSCSMPNHRETIIRGRLFDIERSFDTIQINDDSCAVNVIYKSVMSGKPTVAATTITKIKLNKK